MADKLEKTNHRHQDENNDKPEKKRPKPDESEGAANTVEPKKITNIYYDCLERIFDFLDLNSLLIVAQTCKRLQIAAAAKFGDEFGKKRIRLILSDLEPEISMYQEEIKIFGLKLCLSFLRCFGAKISDLIVCYGHSNSKESYVDQYINQYCADTLVNILICCKSKFPNETFKKPFKNVEHVEIKWCNVKSQLKNFDDWFPNLRHLKVSICSLKTAPLNVFFPHLEHLELHIDEYNFNIEDAANLSQANPQLQSIKLRLPSGLTSVLDAIIANSLITKLEVVGILSSFFIDVSEKELNRFAAEHLLLEELVLLGYRLAAVDAINFIRQMKSLKRFEFQVTDRPECDRITQELNKEWKSEVSTFGNEFYIKLNR